MRATTYQAIFHRILAARGIVPGQEDTNTGTIVNEWINRRLRFAWEFHFWPETLANELRTYAAPYASATSYTQGNVVYFPPTETYYQALPTAAFSGQAPATASGGDYTLNSAYWAECAGAYAADEWASGENYAVGDIVFYPADDTEYQCHTAHTASVTLVPDATGADERWGPLTPFVKRIAWEQAWETNTLGDIKDIWNADPEVYQESARTEVAFELFAAGAVVRTGLPKVYVEHRLRCPSLTGSAYSATSNYTAGTQVYYSTTGDYYLCTATNGPGSSVKAPTDTTAWTRLQVPYCISEYVAQGAAADFLGKSSDEPLRYGGENDEAFYLLRDAVKLLELRQRQARPLRVRNRATPE
jgi:hypothetical protein